MVFRHRCLNSEATPKGTECYDTFKTMQDCFSQYPSVYNKSGSSGDDDADLDTAFESSSSSNPSNVDTAEQEDGDDDTATAAAVPATAPIEAAAPKV